MIRTALCVILFAAFACGEIRAQSLQKLLESASGAASSKKAQPSAAEQKDWASGKLSEFQAKAKALDADELREELRKVNLPEARTEEFPGASQEIIRDYQAAVDTLAAIVNRESQGRDTAPPDAIRVPKDDAEVDALRDKLAAPRGQTHSALKAQPEVTKEPKASVIFEAFSDNALTFHLYYWIDIGRADASKVGSEIRLRIARLCREAGIEIAYPQRDIRLHTAQPISVRLAASEGRAPGNDR